MNYQALGEYTAYQQQARDAADRRFALLHNLGGQLSRLAGEPERNADYAALADSLRQAEQAECECSAALARANAAAALCGKPELSAGQFRRG